jgi:hypothetical protein
MAEIPFDYLNEEDLKRNFLSLLQAIACQAYDIITHQEKIKKLTREDYQKAYECEQQLWKILPTPKGENALKNYPTTVQAFIFRLQGLKECVDKAFMAENGKKIMELFKQVKEESKDE